MQSKVVRAVPVGGNPFAASPEQLVNMGVKTAALLRQIREFGDHSLNYFFEMAWFSIYQACDETTRVKLLEAVEADLARELVG